MDQVELELLVLRGDKFTQRLHVGSLSGPRFFGAHQVVTVLFLEQVAQLFSVEEVALKAVFLRAVTRFSLYFQLLLLNLCDGGLVLLLSHHGDVRL